MLELATEKLAQAAKDFYNMTKIKIVLYDSARKVLYSYPENMCGFCSIIRSNNRLAEKCLSCDNIGFDMCDATRRPYIYKCHMNLAEAIAPICENGIIIGYMMLGQVLCDTEKKTVAEAARRTAPQYGIDTDTLLGELSKLRSVSSDFISSAVNMMSMCACYLYYNSIISIKTNVLHLQLKDFIDTHFSQDLSVKQICDHLFISKSKLYTLSNELFGMGVSDYIRKRRIEEAKKLLSKSSLQISQIASQTGFIDSNYFSRAFKKAEGISPRHYRSLQLK